jgi:hypothetical protein
MSSFLRFPMVSRLGLVIACSFSLMPTGPMVRAEEPRQWAVLIGVQKHHNEKYNLRYTENDVKLLRETLIQRAGLFEDCILELTDGGKGGRPTRDNLQKKLPTFLAKLHDDDRLLVFFSGHGVLFNGETYLVPRDFDARNPDGTGLKLSELRKALDDCKANVKFLILDCCHAGNDKAIAKALPSAGLKQSIKTTLPNCVVLASCNEDETSLEWDDHQQGVFTYWLCRGLSGAGADERGRVTIDKLSDFVDRRVRDTARQLFDAKKMFEATQRPQSMGKRAGSPVVLTLKPEAPEALCARLAADLDLDVRGKKLHKIGVVEFYMPEGLSDQKLGTAFLPAYCATNVRLELEKLGKGSYEVIDAKAMREAVKGIVVEKVRTPAVLEQLGRKAGALEGVVFGVLRPAKRTISLQCELVATAEPDKVDQTTGVLPLSEELYADLGLSYDNRQRPAGSPYDDKVRAHVQEQSHIGHPLQDPKFPFRLQLYTVKATEHEKITDKTPCEEKPLVTNTIADGTSGQKRTELLVGASDGERFEIRVANRSKQRVGLLLLVDGLNTLERKPARIGAGRVWVLDAGKEYRIPGWSYPEEKVSDGKSKVHRFIFRDAARVEGGRKKFGDSIGLITAAFYAEAGRGQGRLFVDSVDVVEPQVLEPVPFRVGNLLGVANIRYVDEQELKKR